MEFIGGTAQLPTEQTCSGQSGTQQVWPPEPPIGLTRMSDAALARFATDMLSLMENESPDDMTPELREYVMLLTGQCQEEMLRRIHVPR